MESFRPRFIPWSERERAIKAEKAEQRRGMLAIGISIAALAISFLTFTTSELSTRADQRRVLLEEISAASATPVKTWMSNKMAGLEPKSLAGKPSLDSEPLKRYMALEGRLSAPWSWIYPTSYLQAMRFEVFQSQELDKAMLQYAKEEKQLLADIDKARKEGR